jgi:hypothetical protein
MCLSFAFLLRIGRFDLPVELSHFSIAQLPPEVKLFQTLLSGYLPVKLILAFEFMKSLAQSDLFIDQKPQS